MTDAPLEAGFREQRAADQPGLIGTAMNRIDGRQKVTGAATYAYEFQVEGAAYGVMVEAAVGQGRLTAIDTAEAEAAPGVLMVMTHSNAPAQAPFGPPRHPDLLSRARPQLYSDEVLYYGQPIALVVAETFEQARAAAGLVRPTYGDVGGAFDFAAAAADAPATELMFGNKGESAVGDFDGAFAAAPVTVDVEYETPAQSQVSMETPASLAVWEGEHLTLYTSSQTLLPCRKAVAATLQIAESQVRVISRYIGGGFGAKLMATPDMILAPLAARAAGRPVKVAMSRQQMFTQAGHRPRVAQRIRLGAEADGTLTAIGHDATVQSARFLEFMEGAGAPTRSLYASPNRLTRHRIAHVDLPHGSPMRGPGEASGLMAFEAAMDELAEALGMDPVELRIRNDTQIHPERGIPFASRNLVPCLREGARRFGWDARLGPGLRREGNQLIGMGMASAIRANLLAPSKAMVRLAPGGGALARLAMTDIGTGTYTILCQVVADRFGFDPEEVRIELGDSDFPPAPGSGGSIGAAATSSAVNDACLKLRARLAEAASADAESPLSGADPAEIRFEDGRLVSGNRWERIGDLVERHWPEGLEMIGEIAPGPDYQAFAQYCFGAHFAEAAVDIDTGEVRVRRMLGVFAAGRILNAKTARSQMVGGMIWGVSSALHEEIAIDARTGAFVNRDLAGYHIASHADAPDVEVVFLDEVDPRANPLGVKGVGELGIAGAAAAVANAVYNACGVRVRHYPITPDKVLAGL